VNSNVSSNGIDPETLAAFLDGKLGAQEREKVIKALGDPEQYESFMEAAALESELGAAEAKPIKFPGRRWAVSTKRWRVGVPVAAAAALAGVLAVSQIIQSARGPESLRLLRNAAFYEQARGNGAPTGVRASLTNIEWPAMRGGKNAEAPRGDAFAAGLLLVNLEFAAKTKEDATIPGIATQLRKVLQRIPGGGPAAALANASDKSSLRDVADTMGPLLNDSPWYRLGIWVGQARLAAAADDKLFFAPDAKGMRALTEIEDHLSATVDPGDENGAAVVGRVVTLRNQINSGQLSDTATISNALDSLVKNAAAIQ
jgi:hypothetical protein